MAHLHHDATDTEIIHFIDQWVRLMEAEDYIAAHAYTAQSPHMGWTPVTMRQIVKSYDECHLTQRVTLEGCETDIQQRKEIYRYAESRLGCIGYVSYDLNIDHVVTDLTATFDIRTDEHGLTIVLDDIHVM